MVIGEFALIDRLAGHLAREGGRVIVGHPDDAAVLRLTGDGVCVAVDLLVDGVHFRRDVSSMADVGWKAIAVNCSDLSAMGAQPCAAVVGLCVPAGASGEDIDQLYAGMVAAGGRWGVSLVGGDTVAGPALTVSVTVLGEVDPEHVLRRSGAQQGERVLLVGELGAAAAALAQLDAGEAPDDRLVAAHRRPRALVAAGRALAAAGATSCIDVSDGLGTDLRHLCAASGVAARVAAGALPVASGVRETAERLGIDPLALICGGGEDFALLATAPAHLAAQAAEAAGAAELVPAAVIGEVVSQENGAPAAVLVRDDGREQDLSGLGYEHSFREQR